MTDPVIVVFCLVNCWSGSVDSEKPRNSHHALDFHIVKVVREIQQNYVCAPGKREVAVEALAGRTFISSNGKLRLGLAGPLDQVGPVECVTAKREDDIRVKLPENF